MRTISLLFLLLLLGCAPARAQPLQAWDGLPAFDPLHLDGAYAGRRVCPMCTHGYDAGLLLFVPGTIDAAAAAALVAPLRRLREEITTPRYRVFVILTGTATPDALLEAVRAAHPQWYVAALSGAELEAAEREFATALGQAPLAFAFAQRRLLRQYDASALLDPDNTLAADARYALRLLHLLHPEPIAADADHDTPQGALWLAPGRLRSRLVLADATAEAACFLDDAGAPIADALAVVRSYDEHSSRPHWARTDADGCLQLALAPGRHRITLHAPGRAPVQRELLRIDGDDRPPVLDRCEGCEAAYDGRPLNLGSQARLGRHDEPGEPLRLSGQVYAADGQPTPGVQIYAYQTDANGIYPPLDVGGPGARSHGRLRGWAVTDGAGHYRFDTVRPGGYPGTRLPQHIHLHVIEAGRCTYYLEDVEFADDPRQTGRPERTNPRGGSGLVHPQRTADGVWEARRDIHLGRGLPDYGRCSSGESGDSD